MRSILSGVGMYDALTILVVVLTLSAVTLLATTIPALRVTKIDPSHTRARNRRASPGSVSERFARIRSFQRLGFALQKCRSRRSAREPHGDPARWQKSHEY